MARRRDEAPLLDLSSPEPISGERAEVWADVERRVVKATLAAGIRRVTDLGLRAEELSDTRARSIWSAALRMIDRGARVAWLDSALVAEIATVTPIERAREAVEWCKQADDEPDDDAVLALVERIRDRRFCAKAYALAARLRESAEGGTPEAASRVHAMISELRDAAESRHHSGGTVALSTALEGWDDFVERSKTQRTGKTLRWGIESLDRWTLMDPGTASVIGAESHVGKTGLMAGAVLATARAGIPAALITLEDPWDEIVSRMGAEIGRLNPQELRELTPKLDLSARVARARLGLVGLPVFGVRVRDRTIEGTLSAMRLAAARGCRLVAVDYLTAIRRPSWLAKNATRRDAIDEVLAVILSCGAERDVHTLIGAQLNREKGRGEVGLNDLRESNAIGESAQNVVGLSRIEGKGGGPRRVRATLAKAKGTSNAGKSLVLTRDDYGVLVEGEGDDEDPVF